MQSQFQTLSTKSDEPMETHAKMFIVDDTRLMILQIIRYPLATQKPNEGMQVNWES